MTKDVCATPAAALQVLTNRELFARITMHMSGVPGFVVAFKEQCAQLDDNDDADGKSTAEMNIDDTVLKSVIRPENALWRRAVRHGNERVLHTLQTLASEPAYEASPAVCFAGIVMYTLTQYVAHQLDLPVVEWICSTFTQPNERTLVNSVIESSIRRGGLELVQCLRAQSLYHEKRLMNSAAAAGDLESVQYLHALAIDYNSKRAMSSAVENGQLAVVEFLHAHYRLETGCFKQSCRQAAALGYAAVLRYLHEHGVKGLGSDTMDYAIEHGHLDIVQFLHEHYRDACRARSVATAAARGYDDVVEFLCTHRPMNEWTRVELLEHAQSKDLVHLAACLERVAHLPDTATRYSYDNVYACRMIPHV